MKTKKLKIKIAKEFRNHRPAVWVNAYAYVKRLPTGFYRVLANDKQGNLYYLNHSHFDIESRSFYDI